jgi:septum site-determining protein MinC
VTGRVRSGQKVEAGKHLMLLGDVNPGGQVTAGGDIFIMGSLRGTATAGSPDDTSSIILALDFRPSQIQIGGFVAAGTPSDPGTAAEFARVENGGIVVEPYLKANPFGKIPWPEIR